MRVGLTWLSIANRQPNLPMLPALWAGSMA
jgi:hypothetical protein